MGLVSAAFSMLQSFLTFRSKGNKESRPSWAAIAEDAARQQLLIDSYQRGMMRSVPNSDSEAQGRHFKRHCILKHNLHIIEGMGQDQKGKPQRGACTRGLGNRPPAFRAAKSIPIRRRVPS